MLWLAQTFVFDVPVDRVKGGEDGVEQLVLGEDDNPVDDVF